MPAGNVNAMGFAASAMGIGQASASIMKGVAEGVAQGVAKGAADAVGAMASFMGSPSSSGGAPGAGMDPSSMAAMQGQAGSDPAGDFFDDTFGDGPDASDAPDPSFLGAGGGGPMPGADPSGMAGMQGPPPSPPVVPGPNGQPMLMTDKGALPLVMTQQGPMAVTPRGPVPLQAMNAASPRAQARQALRAEALAGALAKRMAMASPPPSSTLSGASNFVPARKAPVALSAPVPTSAPSLQAQTAETSAKADPKLNVTGGGGTRIGTTGTGDGNRN